MDNERNEDVQSHADREENQIGEPGTVREPAARQVYGSGKTNKSRGWQIFWGIFTGLSVIANVGLFLMLLMVLAILVTGQGGMIREQIIEESDTSNKIAVIDLQGVIDREQAEQMYQQFKRARRDNKVRGLIFRVNSPGGGITASDKIHNWIRQYRQDTGKPVVAFMEGIAASGGYYTSVACDTIIASPTTITGSIGVIMGYLVLEELFEDKLGIMPVIVKSGEKKDWPSSFRPPSEEQLKYLREKVINPAYERFVEVVADGRKQLSVEEVKNLADGSIYPAGEAVQKKLIDDLGYLEKAIEKVKSLAGIEKARVIKYERPFSFRDILKGHSSGLLELDRSTIYELSTPEVMYLWHAYR